MSEYIVYLLLIFAALADSLSTVFALNKKIKEHGNLSDALKHEKNLFARDRYSKHGLKKGCLIMIFIESLVFIILATVFDCFYENSSFVILGFVIGLPFNNLYHTFISIKNAVLSELLKTIFILICLVPITILLSNYLSIEIIKKFILGEALFLILSPFFEYFYKHIFSKIYKID